MILVRVRWLKEKTKYLRQEICDRFLSNPHVRVSSSKVPVPASASSCLSWNSQQTCHSPCCSVLTYAQIATCKHSKLTLLEKTSGYLTKQIQLTATSTRILVTRDERFPLHIILFHLQRVGHLDIPSYRNTLYFQTGYTSCNTVASMKLHIHICHWICLRKLESTKCLMSSPMQKPFSDGKRFYLRQMYRKCSQNVYRTYCNMHVWCLMQSENAYCYPNYPIKLKASMCANDKLGLRNKFLPNNVQG
jgi:hypothetical protein